tara:strand:- start:579 stop:1199 length:621 start_codon:yes stop_codon:yes gene_type:complete
MVLPLCPFPPIAWFHLAYGGFGAIVDVHENYVKQTIRNRIILANSNGRWELTLPVNRRAANSRLYIDIVFTDEMSPDFLIKHLKTAYGSAPFYEHFEDSLVALINKYGNPNQSLLEFNLQTLEWIREELGIGNLMFSEEYINTDNKDHRIKGSFSDKIWSYKPYPQVFEDRNGFVGGLSVLDAMFHGGPESKRWWSDNVNIKEGAI